MKQSREKFHILVVTDKIGGELTNGAQVFANALLLRLAERCKLTIITYKSNANLNTKNKILSIPDELDENEVLSWLVKNLKGGNWSLIYNLGATSTSCFLTSCLTHIMPNLPLVNHFQITLSEYARVEGLSDNRINDFNLVQQQAGEHAKMNIFPSFAELSLAYAQGWNIHRSRNFVVPNAFVGTMKKPVSCVDKPCKFLATGRFSDYVKGADLVYRAFRELFKKYPQVKLQIAGDDKRFLEILNPLPNDSYEFLGWLSRSKLHAAMNNADAVIVPSRYEPFGLVALEAMAVGTPVIATAVGGLSEMIEHNYNGLLCPPNEGSLGIRLAMESVVLNRQKAFSMGVNAQETVRQNYQLNRVAKTIGGMLENLVSGYGTIKLSNEYNKLPKT